MYFYFQLTILGTFLFLAVVALIRNSRKSSMNSEADLLVVIESRLATLNTQDESLPSKFIRIVCD